MAPPGGAQLAAGGLASPKPGEGTTEVGEAAAEAKERRGDQLSDESVLIRPPPFPLLSSGFFQNMHLGNASGAEFPPINIETEGQSCSAHPSFFH